jgi:hypothetical protein
MNQEEYQQLENLQVDNFNRWVRYDNSRHYGDREIRLPHGAYRNGPVAKVIALVFWVAIAAWIVDALVIL